MDKTIILTVSKHKGNTMNLVRNVSNKLNNVEIYDCLNEQNNIDLSKYKFVGVASGIYFGDIDKSLYDILKKYKIKDIFLIITSRSNNPKYLDMVKEKLNKINVNVIDGFYYVDKKKHIFFKFLNPKNNLTEKEVNKAVDFVDNIINC